MIDHFRPWWQNPICVIDFETTGPDPATCHPVQVAAVRFEMGEVVNSYSTLIDPGVPIPAEATAIHGITDEMVDDAHIAPDALALVRPAAHDAIPCAYNAPYDRAIWDRNSEPLAAPWLDPLVAVRELDRYARGTGRHRLAATCERWNVPFDGEVHDALADATATGRLLWAMRSKIGDITYSEFIRRQRLHAAAQDKRFQEWLAKQPPREEGAA